MPSLCGVCGENAVISDRDGDMEYLVCQECGCIATESSFAETSHVQTDNNPGNFFGNMNLPRYVKQGYSESEGKKAGRERAKTVAITFKFTRTMTEAVDNLYVEVYKTDEIIKRNICVKLIISVVCVFIVAREYDRPITIKEFCKQVKVPINQFAEAYKLILQKKGIHFPYQSVASMCAVILGQTKMSKDLIHLTEEILLISDRAWIVSGRHRDLLIHAAAYLAWVSSDVINHSNTRFKSFCKKYGFRYSHASAKRLQEIKEILLELGKNLPWASNIDKRDFVVDNLNEILKYRCSLFHESLMKSMQASAQNNSMMDETSHDENGVCESEQSGGDLVLRNSSSSCDTVSYHQQRSQQDESDAKTNHNLFQPPAIKNPRKRPSTNHLEVEECDGDAELSESQDIELNKYIRTKEEVRIIQNMEKKQKLML